ncbi:VOC family protein [Micromonospora sp. NPDC050686]|uniref:VOC family protein n=1 Tax=Micromonospora sp. NPDC050686 TaxID=3154631 RepID=UPI00340A3735
MERVTGIGGLFFRVKDPTAMTKWYVDHLGLTPPPTPEEDRDWWQEQGPTVFAPYGADVEEETGQSVRLNFRVRDLPAMLGQLRAAGVEVSPEAEEYPEGRFGWAIDPEGNRIELWEPAPDRLKPPTG